MHDQRNIKSKRALSLRTWEALQLLIVPVTAYMLKPRYRISLKELSELKFVPYNLIMWYYFGPVTHGRWRHRSLFPKPPTCWNLDIESLLKNYQNLNLCLIT